MLIVYRKMMMRKIQVLNEEIIRRTKGKNNGHIGFMATHQCHCPKRLANLDWHSHSIRKRT
jgi:hypothetical protein